MRKRILIFLTICFCLSLILFTFSACDKQCKHSSTSWVIDTPQTCEDKGLKHLECNDCKVILKTEMIEKHNYINYVCSDCGLERYTNSLTFETTDTFATVTGINDKTATEIIIPSKYNNLPVTNISDSAFLSNSSIMEVTFLGNNLSTIGESAFASCTSLRIIDLPNGITKIAPATFAECTNLESVKIPNSVTTIEVNAFAYCTALSNIEIPNGVGIPNLHPLKNNGVF